MHKDVALTVEITRKILEKVNSSINKEVLKTLDVCLAKIFY